MVFQHLRLWIITILGLFFIAPMAFAQTSGTFMVVKGDVTVTTKDGKTDKAKVGKKVFATDTITSGADSRAKIVMADKNVINISPDTKLVLEKYVYDAAKGEKNVTLNVLQGKVRATVEQKYDGEKNQFNVKTPAAVAGVRGTDFLTGYNAKTKESRIVTFEGKVAVGMPSANGQILNPVFVNPGQETVVSSGRPPAPPAAISSDDFKSMNDSSKAESNEPAKEDKAPPGQEKKDDKDKDKKEKDNSKDGSKDKSANKGPEGPAPDGSAPPGPAPVEGGFVGSGEPNAPAGPPPPPGTAPAGFDGRMPAADGPVSMIDYNKDVNIGTMLPPPPMMPGMGVYDPTRNMIAQPPPTNSFINETLLNGRTRLNIIILPQ